MKVKVLHGPIPYGMRYYRPGDVVDMDAPRARFELEIGRCAKYVDPPKKKVTKKKVPQKGTSVQESGTYKTRDMKAE